MKLGKSVIKLYRGISQFSNLSPITVSWNLNLAVGRKIHDPDVAMPIKSYLMLEFMELIITTEFNHI